MDTKNSKQCLSSQDKNRQKVAISNDLDRSEPISKELEERLQIRITGSKESNYFKYGRKQLLAYLKNNTANASMIEEATGIKQKNLCRYKRELEKIGLLWERYKDPCQITGFYSAYHKIDPCLNPLDAKIKLF